MRKQSLAFSELSQRSLYIEFAPDASAAAAPPLDGPDGEDRRQEADDDDPAVASGRREEMIIIHAPSGRMGLLFDTTSGKGAASLPIIRAVRDSSVVAGEVRVGDRLLAIDDTSVVSMSSVQITKTLVDKIGQPTRKLSLLRAGEL